MAIGFNGLNDTVPADTAYIGDGASEIRSIKDALNTTFPNVTGEITKPTGYGTAATTQPTAADYSLLFTDMSAIVNPTTSNSPVIPQGTVVNWFGDPTDGGALTALQNKGWYLCNGQTAPNGFQTPNLTGRFVKGDFTAAAGATVAGSSVGTLTTSEPFVPGTNTAKTLTKDVTISEANIPAHDHAMFSEDLGNRNYVTTAYSGPIAADSGNPGHQERDYTVTSAGSEPTIGKTGDWGNASVTPLTITHDANAFNHEHEVTIAGDLEPAHMLMAFICYCGVV